MKQIIAVALAVLTLCILLVACGDNSAAEDSKIVIPTTAEGATVYAVDDKGYPVYPTDAQGDPVYATDAAGEPIIAKDANGDPIIGNGGATESKPAATETPAPAASKSDSPASATVKPAATEAPAPATDKSSEPAVQPTEEELPVIIGSIPTGEYELPILP